MTTNIHTIHQEIPQVLWKVRGHAVEQLFEALH